MIDAGRLLVEGLRQRLALRAAFWLYLLEEDIWRLHFASPRVEREGPRKGYLQIQAVLDAEYALGHIRPDVIALDDISILDVQEPLFRVWRSAAVHNGGYTDRRIRKVALNGQYFEDAYIYFIV